MRYANQINNTTRRQALYRQELKDTEIAMNDQKRGTSLVRENLSLLTRETTAAINKFKSQGKALRNKEEYKYGNQIKERNQLIEKEKLKLQELIEKKAPTISQPKATHSHFGIGSGTSICCQPV